MAVVLFSRIGQVEKAEKVFAWTLENMYNEKKIFSIIIRIKYGQIRLILFVGRLGCYTLFQF